MSSIPTMNGREIVEALDSHYPKIRTPLSHKNAFQLLIATILSAQCTDAQVNKVTPKLFELYPSSKEMALASILDLQQLIKSTGFFRVKSRRIREVSRRIEHDFNGKVPQSMEELTTLSGVGRKTANVVLSAGFDRIEGIAVDTHVKRLAERIGLSNERNPEKIETDLMKVTTKELWPRLSLLLILHGRRICHAKKPQCDKCVLKGKCLYYSQRK
ncbi:MAG: endonuclease III [Nitrososphaerales archaeon]